MEEFCFDGHPHAKAPSEELRNNIEQQRLVQRNLNDYTRGWENGVSDSESKLEYALEAWAGSLLFINQVGMFRKVHKVIR